MICKVCGKEVKLLKQHIRKYHKLTLRDYAIKYLGSSGKCKICGKDIFYKYSRDLEKEYCSRKCVSVENFKEVHNLFKNSEEFKREFIKKRRENWEKKYNVQHYAQTPEFKKKMFETSMKKYNVPNPMQSEEVKKRRKKVLEKRYGKSSLMEVESVKKRILEGRRKNSFKRIMGRLKENKIEPLFSYESYKGCRYIYKFKCEKCGNIFEATLNYGTPVCPFCKEKKRNNKSSFEMKLSDYIRSLGYTVEENCRKIIKPLELDIYVKNKKFAIEFNGVYWHTHKIKKNIYYHYEKYRRCKEKNIVLFMFFDDEWKYKREILFNKIDSKLGKNKIINFNKKIHAIEKLNSIDAFYFINKNSMYDYGRRTNYIGIYDNNLKDYLSVLGYVKSKRKNEDYDVKIVSYMEKIGIMSFDFLKIFIKYLKSLGYKKIWFEVDNRFNDFIFFEKIGFKFLKEIKPRFYYVKKRIRIKENLINKIEDVKNLDIVYDCGKTVYKI